MTAQSTQWSRTPHEHFAVSFELFQESLVNVLFHLVIVHVIDRFLLYLLLLTATICFYLVGSKSEVRKHLTFGNPEGLLVIYVGRFGPEKVRRYPIYYIALLTCQCHRLQNASR